MSRNPIGLVQRGAKFYIRVRVPDDLREAIGKREIVKSLGTGNRDDAVVRCAAEYSTIRQEFIDNRLVLADPKIARASSSATRDLMPDEIDRSIYRWVKTRDQAAISSLRETKYKTPDAMPDIAVNIKDELASFSRVLHEAPDAAEIVRLAETAIRECRFLIGRASSLYLHLCNQVGEAECSTLERQLAFAEGHHTLPPLFLENEYGATIRTEVPEAITSKSDKVRTVAQLIDAYMADPAKNRSEKTKIGYRSLFYGLQELLGPDRLIRNITRDDCNDLRSLLMRIPVNAKKYFPSLTLEQAANQAAGVNMPKLTAKTVNSYLNNLSSLFKWAEANHYVTRNPAENLRVAPTPQNTKPPRQQFTIDDLNTIFHAPLFTGCIDDEEGYNQRGSNLPRRGRFWVPLLALFMGMRANECCQLETTDVEESDGTTVIHIRPSADGRKRVKTQTSIRTIPVHPFLLDVGFSVFADQQRNAGAARLFPELTVGHAGYVSDPFSQWFRRFLEKQGVKRAGITFHSFRHNFRTATRNAQLTREATDILGGWKRRHNAADDYGSQMSPRILMNEIAKIEYPGLSIDHLRPANRESVRTRGLDLTP